jgi:spore germination cell wall hydrolase CwlJ-like protein
MGAIAAEGARLASGFAPVRSGRLRNTIRGNRAKAKAIVIAGRAKTPYAGAINYGWPKRGIKPALFMQRADKALADKAVSMLEAGIDKAIKRAGFE